MLRCVFLVEYGIARFLCAMRVFKVQTSSSSPSTKFRFFRGLRCWASLWRKIAYSIIQTFNHSPSLFDAPGTEALALQNFMKFDVHHHDSNLVHLPLKQLLLILIILFFVFIDKLIWPRSLIYHSYADHTQPLSIMSLEVISSEACVFSVVLVCVTVSAVDDNRIELIWFASRSNPWNVGQVHHH